MVTTMIVKSKPQQNEVLANGLWFAAVVLTLVGFLWMESLNFSGWATDSGETISQNAAPVNALSGQEGHYNGVVLSAETGQEAMSYQDMELDEELADN